MFANQIKPTVLQHTAKKYVSIVCRSVCRCDRRRGRGRLLSKITVCVLPRFSFLFAISCVVSFLFFFLLVPFKTEQNKEGVLFDFSRRDDTHGQDARDDDSPIYFPPFNSLPIARLYLPRLFIIHSIVITNWTPFFPLCFYEKW